MKGPKPSLTQLERMESGSVIRKKRNTHKKKKKNREKKKGKPIGFWREQNVYNHSEI